MITGRVIDFRSFGQFAGVALGGYAMGAVFSTFNVADAPGCGIFGVLEWAGLEVLQTAIRVTIWQAVTTHFCQTASSLPELLQNGTHIWALICQLSLGF